MIKAWSKCHRKNGEEHEYKRQPTQVLCDESLLTQQPTSTQPFDFGRIGEVQGGTTETVVTARRERGRKEGSNDLVQSSGDIVYLASDASSCEIKLYVLQQDVTTATKKARGMCFDADVSHPSTFKEEAETEISVWDICGSLKESYSLVIKLMKRIYTLSISHDRSCRISHHRRRQGMWRERPRTNKYHIKKIKTSKEEGKFWRVYVLWWLTRKG